MLSCSNRCQPQLQLQQQQCPAATHGGASRSSSSRRSELSKSSFSARRPMAELWLCVFSANKLRALALHGEQCSDWSMVHLAACLWSLPECKQQEFQLCILQSSAGLCSHGRLAGTPAADTRAMLVAWHLMCALTSVNMHRALLMHRHGSRSSVWAQAQAVVLACVLSFTVCSADQLQDASGD